MKGILIFYFNITIFICGLLITIISSIGYGVSTAQSKNFVLVNNGCVVVDSELIEEVCEDRRCVGRGCVNVYECFQPLWVVAYSFDEMNYVNSISEEPLREDYALTRLNIFPINSTHNCFINSRNPGAAGGVRWTPINTPQRWFIALMVGISIIGFYIVCIGFSVLCVMSCGYYDDLKTKFSTINRPGEK